MKIHACPPKSIRCGFTLIEMLVVIAIIALLASLVIPTTGRALDRARQTQSTSNLRQIGQAFQMYTMEPSNRFNQFPATVDPEGGTFGTPWFVQISPYLQREAGGAGDLEVVFRCPVWARIYRRSVQSDWNQLGYGMNIYLSGSPSQGWPFPSGGATAYKHRLSDITNPSGTILIADESTWNWNIHSGTFDNQFQDGRYYERALGRQRGYRHGNGANFLFVDGRVALLGPDDVKSVLPN